MTRILDCKKKLKLYEKRIPFVGGLAKVVDTPPVQALEAEVARRSLTLVREQPDALPLRKGAKLLSLVVADEATLNGPAGALGTEIKARVPSVKTVTLDPRSTPEETRAAVEAAKDADVVLVSLFVRTRSGLGKIAVPEAGRTAIPQLLALGKPVVVVSFGSPYLLRDFPDLKTYLCAWGGQDIAQVAAVQALFGESAIGGKLPITIPGLAKRGDGIEKPASSPVTVKGEVQMRSPKRDLLRRVIRLKAMRRALRVAAALALAPLIAAAASAQPAPSSPSKKSPSSGSSSDLAEARAVFEKNIAAIQNRDKAAYLACYLDSARLVRATPEGPAARLRGVREAGGHEVAGHARRGRPQARAGLSRHRLRHVSLQGALRRGRALRPLRAALREDSEGLEDHA